MSGRRRRAGGFTLIELMVTLGITGMLLAMLGGILTSIIETQRKVEATLLRERVGSAILDLIGRDLQGVYAYEQAGTFKGTDESSGGAAADRFEFVTTRDPAIRAEEEQAEADEARERRAGSFSGDDGPGGADEVVLRDPPMLTQVAYQARTSRAHPDLLTVFRSERRYIPPPPPVAAGAAGTAGAGTAAATGQLDASTQRDIAESERFMEVYDRVRSFNVSYLFTDPESDAVPEWRDAWDDPEGKLPAAVEVTLEIVPDPRLEAAAANMGRERPRKIYKTVIAIPVTQPKPPQQPGQAGGTGQPAGGTPPK